MPTAERYAESAEERDGVPIGDSYSFTPEDQPSAVAAAVRSFAT
jgi:hypothetical protein